MDQLENEDGLRVALLYGGNSTEREVSIASAKQVLRVISERHNVVPIDTAQFSWVGKLINSHPDVVFICLHGEGGEDGVVQGLCESLGLPYTGSGVRASALAIDKVLAKMVVSSAGVRTPLSCCVTALTELDASATLARMGGKAVVKPRYGGSSVGVYIVDAEPALQEAVSAVLNSEGAAIIEQYVKGRELTVAVQGIGEPEALPIIEIVSNNESYDYEAKYTDGMSRHVCPAQLSPYISEECANMAETAHAALGCRGYSRSDFLLSEDGKVWYLETNTIPGMTANSLLPDAARATGVSYEDLCFRIIDCALEAGE